MESDKEEGLLYIHLPAGKLARNRLIHLYYIRSEHT